ncbi:MAG: hypothetical protein MJZ26_09310 [Fibrobacter sp.]|nr:hypothetical protein [Fibrobacter sp.]
MNATYKLFSGISETAGHPVETTSSMNTRMITGHSVVFRHAALKARPASCEESEKNQW